MSKDIAALLKAAAKFQNWAKQQLSNQGVDLQAVIDVDPMAPLPKAKRSYDPDAPLSSFDKERMRGVRCEQCEGVLPYGSKGYKQRDDPEAPRVFLCKRCRSGHEEKFIDGGLPSGLNVKTSPNPPPRTCNSVVIRDEKGVVKDVWIGCKQKTSEWTEYGTRTLQHSHGCQVYAASLRELRVPDLREIETEAL